jgi:hypothetical protein
MKPSEIYVGLQVVTSDAINTTVFMVKEIEGHQTHLVYKLKTGTYADGGWIDASYLRLPTIQQMAN